MLSDCCYGNLKYTTTFGQVYLRGQIMHFVYKRFFNIIFALSSVSWCLIVSATKHTSYSFLVKNKRFKINQLIIWIYNSHLSNELIKKSGHFSSKTGCIQSLANLKVLSGGEFCVERRVLEYVFKVGFYSAVWVEVWSVILIVFVYFSPISLSWSLSISFLVPFQ